MKKVFAILLLFSLTCYSQDKNSVSWPADQLEQATSDVSIPVTLTSQQQKNLNILCRVWGFLKYFHPTVASGKVNADKGLFAILPAVLRASDNNSLDETLFKWVNELGTIPFSSDTPKIHPDTAFIENDMRWLMKGSLVGGRLRPQLLNIFRKRHTGNGYYVSRASEGNPDFSNELKYNSVKGEDDGMRILSLFRYWNTIEYFFPSKYLTADNWDNVLDKFIPLFTAAKTDSAYRMTCIRLVASIHDTHGILIGSDTASRKYHMGKYFSPFLVANIENSMTIFYFASDSLEAISPLKVGDRILAINGVNVKKMIDSIKPYIPASNVSQLIYRAMNKLTRSFLPENELTIQRGKDVIKLKVTYFQRVPPGNRRGFYSSMHPMYKHMGEDIGYINLEKAKADSLPVIFKAFEQTRGLVIDLRNYPTGRVTYKLSNYIKPQFSVFVQATAVDFQLPGRFIMNLKIAGGKDNPEYYKGKIVILVNEQSQSNAEFTAMELQAAPNAIVMGSQTSGADGDVSTVFLPGGMNSYISGLGIYYPDNRPTQGIGIVPDIKVRPTAKGLSEGKDEVLEAAIKYLRGNK
jgi:C-terminal processing protease CtpA/Prc